MLKMMIVGATSAIAQETARCFAADGASFFLVARSQEKLETLKNDLIVRGANDVYCFALDLNEFERHRELVDAAIQAMNGLDSVIIAHGTLTDQRRAEEDFEYALQELNTNAISVILLLTIISNHFEEQRKGSIAVISSVAGDRGRGSNYIYGTAKAAVSTYLQGLRNRMAKAGVNVLTVKPGFVDTPMTADVKKNFLFASPEKVGKDIYEAMKNKRDILYTPWFWMGIMMMIRNIPERIFKRLNM
ncbi:MAG: SDR family oxidoreductase [Chloroflexi bacterium]|nr:SDR family oxidoreductase [Chloroflexota bacterium]